MLLVLLLLLFCVTMQLLEQPNRFGSVVIEPEAMTLFFQCIDAVADDLHSAGSATCNLCGAVHAPLCSPSK